MKRYLTVKESAKLLGVSTNTIYTYLKEGKIVGRRIGRGRFKIPYSQLEPFIGTYESQNKTNTLNFESQTQNVIQAVKPSILIGNNIKSQNTEKVYAEIQPRSVEELNFTTSSLEESEDITPGNNDIVFYRLFRALFLIGLSLVYFLTDSLILKPAVGGSFTVNLFPMLLPVFLLTGGLLTLARVTKSSFLAKWDFAIHVYLTLVLAVATYSGLISGHLGLVVFVAPLLMLVASHFLRGFSNSNIAYSFKTQFIGYTLLLAVAGGIVLIFDDSLFPLVAFQNFLSEQKTLVVMIWYVAFVPLFIYLLSPYSKNQKWPNAIIALYSLFAIFFATQLTIKSTWDVAYLSFLTGTFGLFLAGWDSFATKIKFKNINFIVLAFDWIAVSLVLGILAIYASQVRIQTKSQIFAEEKLNQMVADTDKLFNEKRSVLVRFATQNEVVELIENRQKSELTDYAKIIFEEVGYARRIVIFDKEGVALSSYPLNTLIGGTNFSSRDYIVNTKETYQPYISKVYEGVTGVSLITQTEPIFKDNKLVGIIGLGWSLEDLKEYFMQIDGREHKISALDANGVYVFDSDASNIGKYSNVADFKNNNRQRQNVIVNSRAKVPAWEIYLEVPIASILDDMFATNILVSTVLIVNAIITMVTAVVLASKDKESFLAETKNEKVSGILSAV